MIHRAPIRTEKIFMNKFLNIIAIIVIYFFLISKVIAVQSKYFNKGLELFQSKEFEKSKIEFEKDIVFNPKSEKSYLYLAKIFEKSDNQEEEEINLNNVLLLNPQNDEAIYMLTILKIRQSNYNTAKDLIEKFVLVCKSFCSKEKEMRTKFEKLIPNETKGNN